MKKYKGLFIILVCLTSTLFFETMAANQGDGKGKGSQTKFLPKTADDPVSSILDINNITSWITADGYWPSVWGGDGWNGSYPKGQPTGVDFQEGIVWGGIVNDGTSPNLRVGGNTYFPGTTRLQRLYRVRPDYATADLTDDAANFFLVSNSDVTSSQIATIRAQYEKDWNEWPASSGAPYEDVNHDGIYEPNIDIPGIPGASQTIFVKFNDASSVSAYGSPPIGLTINETVWAYSIANPLNNISFRKAQVIYTGIANAPSTSKIDSMYLVQWCDFDIGNAGDDFAGCDTTLGLGYCYNATAHDAYFDAIGSPPPAAGFDFFQGVSQYTGNSADSAVFNLQYRHGYKYTNLNSQNNPMTTFVYFAAGGAWSDPAGQSYTGSEQWYSLMRGYQPQAWPTKLPFPTNVSGQTVGGDGTYLLPGDPVTHTGWVDGEVEGAGDRRVCLETGPFNMSLNDTVEIVTALISGTGSDNLSSISVLKFYDKFAQYAYDQLFDLPNIPSPVVSAAPINGGVILNWDNSQNVNDIELADHKGYKFEGYNVYQLPSTGTDLSLAKRIATYDVVDGIATIEDQQFDVSTGAIITKPVQFGGDNGVKRYITIKNDALRGNVPMVNGTNYYFAVTAYGYNPDPTVPFHALESSPVPIIVVPQIPNPGVSFPSTGSLTTKHSAGSANATLNATVVDPTQVTGHSYKVTLHDEKYSLGADSKWTDITPPSKKLGKASDLTGSSISSAASWGEKQGSIDIHYTVDVQSPNYDYCDGVKLVLPAGVTIDTLYQPISNNTGGKIPVIVDRATNTIFYGDTSIILSSDTTLRSTNGVFAGGEDLVVTVSPATLPIITNYTMYDDNWGDNNGYVAGLVDVSGTDTLKGPIANKIVTQHQWNVTDMTSGQVVLSNQTIFSGTDIYAPSAFFPTHLFNGPGGSTQSPDANVGVTANRVIDGVQFALSGSFSAPTTITNSDQATVTLNGTTLYLSTAVIGATTWHDGGHNYFIADFTNFSFPDGTAASSDPSYGGSGGVPLTDVADLQQDYELRWTGVAADTTAHSMNFQYIQSGGQMATLMGASGYSIADHPLNPNYGTKAPFAVRIPFELWNVDKNEQVNLMFWDRRGDITSGSFKVWNSDDRVYAWVINTKYQTTPIDPAGSTVKDSATWNWVFWGSTWTTGDVINITYANPLQVGSDEFTFTAPAPIPYNSDLAKTDVDKINVFPNPYYGFNSRETTRSGKYVTFSHLPQQATIRIFDIAGHQVAVINKNDPGQFTNWNLLNDHNYPVASGVYIVYIDMPALGTTKILKLAVVQEQQILTTY